MFWPSREEASSPMAQSLRLSWRSGRRRSTRPRRPDLLVSGFPTRSERGAVQYHSPLNDHVEQDDFQVVLPGCRVDWISNTNMETSSSLCSSLRFFVKLEMRADCERQQRLATGLLPHDRQPMRPPEHCRDIRHAHSHRRHDGEVSSRSPGDLRGKQPEAH